MYGSGPLWEWHWQGNIEVRVQNPISNATLSTKNPTWNYLRIKSGILGDELGWQRISRIAT